MRVFSNPFGIGDLYFDNLTSPEGVPVAYDPVQRRFTSDAAFCANRALLDCNWVAASTNAPCDACAMTKMAPDTSHPSAVDYWAKTEAAKRWLLDNLSHWGWFGQNDTGPAPVFHMLTEGANPVVMGHGDGVVTISIDESDPVSQIQRREALKERYRTMIGHMRHEIAHFLWWRLSIVPDFLEEFRTVFGDERTDYGAALERHYANGPIDRWQDSYLTAYAAVHPHEDWAETTAHLLHLIDISDSFMGVSLSAPDTPPPDWDPYHETDPEKLTTTGGAIAMRINHVNRSMGLPDLYPFVVSDPARLKLSFAHKWLRRGP